MHYRSGDASLVTVCRHRLFNAPGQIFGRHTSPAFNARLQFAPEKRGQKQI